MEIITSKENKIIKELKKLRKKKYRDINKQFLAEGIKFLDYKNYLPTTLIIREDILENKNYLKRIEEINCKKIYVSEKIFSELSSQENSQGLIILYDKRSYNLNEIKDDVVILDDISDPGNMGTIIRICDATNFKTLIATKGTVDCYNEKVVRATMGSILNINIIYLEREEIINFLAEKNYKIFATHLDDKAISYTRMGLDKKNAVIFGNEGNGVKKDFLEKANSRIIIPILTKTESLNVGVATGIILYKIRELDGSIK